LDDLHTAGILHRDIKVANILLDFKSPVIIDGIQITTADIISFSQDEMNDFLSRVDLSSTDFDVKLGDLGFSKFLPDTRMRSRTLCGTPLYMSPQIVFEEDYSFKADIWSLGSVYYELLTGHTPFQSKNMK
jgi:serine/threonine protein kinase